MAGEFVVLDGATWLEPLQRLGLALAIGFLIGIERGWKQRNETDGQRVAGIRTFALIGLLGGVSGLLLPALGPLPVSAIALAFCVAFTAFQFRQAEEDGDNSVTSTIAGFLVFALALYAVVGEAVIAAAAGVTVAMMLAFKEGLHHWVRSITWKEIRSALLILAATCIVLPLIPEGYVDPWRVVEPRSLWWMTILIASVSFAGYIALRVVGPRSGLMIGAAVGAIVSSTAVTIDLGRRVRDGEITAHSGAAAAALAATISLARCGLVASAFSLPLAMRLWPVIGVSVAACLACAWILARPAAAPAKAGPYDMIRSPLDLRSVAKFAVLLGVLTIGANLVSHAFGPYGLDIFAATAGLVDIDAVTLAVGKLATTGLATNTAATAILIGILANQLFKLAASLVTGSLDFSLRLAVVLVFAVSAGVIAQTMLPLALGQGMALP